MKDQKSTALMGDWWGNVDELPTHVHCSISDSQVKQMYKTNKKGLNTCMNVVILHHSQMCFLVSLQIYEDGLGLQL